MAKGHLGAIPDFVVPPTTPDGINYASGVRNTSKITREIKNTTRYNCDISSRKVLSSYLVDHISRFFIKNIDRRVKIVAKIHPNCCVSIRAVTLEWDRASPPSRILFLRSNRLELSIESPPSPACSKLISRLSVDIIEESRRKKKTTMKDEDE
ncbi:hypothetical protein QYF36_022804 [Acer negundo]|nr:hypothetical protein QYF36_022804 [Acer negundo]